MSETAKPDTPAALATEAAKTNAPTSAGHHPAQPTTPVAATSHPNQSAPRDEGPKIPAAPAKPAARPTDPIVAEAQALRDEVEKHLNDGGEVRKLRDRHADLLARANDTLSRSDFAAATGILDLVAGHLNRLGPRP